MPDLNDLSQQLVNLPQRQYSDLIRKVDSERRKAVEHEEKQHPPHIGMSRDEFARWVARRHFAVDKGISRVFYLPTNAPPGEVRLLEVNELAAIPENAPVEAADFMPDIEGTNYTLLVADVSPNQLERIKSHEIALPTGWTLSGAQEIPGL